MSLEIAEKAAKAAGFSVLNAKAIKDAGVLGQFISEVGAIDLGRARLALNLERAERAMRFCEEQAAAAEDVDSSIGFMKVVADILGKSNNAAEALMKSAQTAAETAKAEISMQIPGFSPGATAKPAAPSVNVLVSSKDAEVRVTGTE